MAKPSLPLKREQSSTFSAMEMEVARQLMQLCHQQRKLQEEESISPRGNFKKMKELEEEEEEEEEHLVPRKKRFKPIDFIYNTTKPLVVQNVKKMDV
ncbi:hypothetical protein V6N13_083145 [Hibiscus sabdariffa]|uniref:Uncharacterized protein n=1 Tax=Hibiscus sabdariffa TaxID=183260 RepID=A0ABR2SY02_9ROSI